MDSTQNMTIQILVTLRKIIRAIDLYSKKLIQQCGLTGPQLILLQEINRLNNVSVSELAKKVSLSNATVTDILDRLEKRGFLYRNRSDKDKRRVLVTLTDLARETLKKTPPLIQEHFTSEFEKLQKWEQTSLLSSLQRIVSMMEAEEIEAKPILISGAIAVSEKKADEFLKDVEIQESISKDYSNNKKESPSVNSKKSIPNKEK